MGDLEEGEILEKEVDDISAVFWQSVTPRVSTNRQDEEDNRVWPNKRSFLAFEYNHGIGTGVQKTASPVQYDNRFDDIDWTQFGYNTRDSRDSSRESRHNSRDPRDDPRDSRDRDPRGSLRDKSFSTGYRLNSQDERFPPHHHFEARDRVRPRRYSSGPRNDVGFHRMRQEFASTRNLPQRRYHAPVPQFINRRDTPYQHRSPRKGHLTEQNEKSTEYARGFLESPSSQAKTDDRNNSRTYLRKRPLTDGKITNALSHSAETDEYDLDDYQLLLERHRLIQQQLSVIGQQEQYLEAQASGSANFEDDADFVIVPDPNCIDESSEMNNENVEDPGSCFTEGEIQMLPENAQNTPEVQTKEVINDSAITENPSIESKGNDAFLNQPKNTDNNNVIRNKEQTENTAFVDKELGVHKGNEPQPQKRKQNRPRRQRRKKFKSKNPNLQVVAKEGKQVEAAKNKVNQSNLQDK